MDFTENFIKEFEKQQKDVQIKKFWNREKSLILDYPYKNINIEIKPDSTGIFVIQLINFEFFDYKLLNSYLKGQLKNEDARFILNSKCIYIYPNNRENVKQCIDILNYTSKVILKTIEQIKAVLTLDKYE